MLLQECFFLFLALHNFFGVFLFCCMSPNILKQDQIFHAVFAQLFPNKHRVKVICKPLKSAFIDTLHSVSAILE